MSTIHDQHPKTKRLLRKAFLSLLEEKPVHDITIKDVVERAELSRPTFYLHYQAKDALLDEIITDLAGGLTSLMAQVYEDPPEEIGKQMVRQSNPQFVRYFVYVRENAEIFLVLLREGSGVPFRQRFTAHFDEYRDRQFHLWMEANSFAPEEHDLKEKLYTQAIGGFINTIFQWLEAGMVPDEETMAKHHARVWMSYSLIQKDDQEDIYVKGIMDQLEHGDPSASRSS